MVRRATNVQKQSTGVISAYMHGKVSVRYSQISFHFLIVMHHLQVSQDHADDGVLVNFLVVRSKSGLTYILLYNFAVGVQAWCCCFGCVW